MVTTRQMCWQIPLKDSRITQKKGVARRAGPVCGILLMVRMPLYQHRLVPFIPFHMAAPVTAKNCSLNGTRVTHAPQLTPWLSNEACYSGAAWWLAIYVHDHTSSDLTIEKLGCESDHFTQANLLSDCG